MRLEDVTTRLSAQVPAEGQSCEHGERVLRSGFSERNGYSFWAGMFCPEKRCRLWWLDVDWETQIFWHECRLAELRVRVEGRVAA